MPADTAKKTKATKVVYTCPMHTDVVAYKPGKCPKPGLRYDAGKKERSEKEINENVIHLSPVKYPGLTKSLR